MTSTLMAAAIVIFAAAIAILNFVSWRRNRAKPWSWIHLAYSILGVYWAGLYLVVLVAPVGAFDPVSFGRNMVRPPFLLTLAVILSATINGRKSR